MKGSTFVRYLKIWINTAQIRKMIRLLQTRSTLGAVFTLVSQSSPDMKVAITLTACIFAAIVLSAFAEDLSNDSLLVRESRGADSFRKRPHRKTETFKKKNIQKTKEKGRIGKSKLSERRIPRKQKKRQENDRRQNVYQLKNNWFESSLVFLWRKVFQDVKNVSLSELFFIRMVNFSEYFVYIKIPC